MKTKAVEKLEQIIRESLNNTNSYNVREQKIPNIPKPQELKYTYDKNIKTTADKEQFRQWMRITYPSLTRDKGLKSSEDFNTLKDADKTLQLQLLKSLWSQKNSQGTSYGREFLESERGITPNDGTDIPWYKETSTYVIAGIVVFSALGLYFTLRGGRRGVDELIAAAGGEKKYGWWKRRLANRYRAELALSEHQLTRNQIDQLVDTIVILRGRGNKKKLLEKYLRGHFPPDIVPKLAQAIADNPEAQNKITIEFTGTAIKQFEMGNPYMTEKKLETSLSKDMFAKNVKQLRKKRAQNTGIKPATKKSAAETPSVAVTIINKGKLKGQKTGLWCNFNNATATADDINKAAKDAMGNEVTLKGRNELAARATKKLNAKLGSKQGVWLLDKHVKAKTFPDFLTWQMDRRAANATTRTTINDYWLSKTIWNLTR
jgi:hypothetical protein